MPGKRWGFWIWITIALLAVALLVISTAWMIGSRLVQPANHKVTMPVGFEAQAITIPGPGHAIAAWWSDAGHDSPVVLLLHAVRADRSMMVSRAQLLQRHGFSVLLIDLQAHGETPGSAITFGARESGDVVAAREWLKKVAPARRIGVIGCSLGGASLLLAPQPIGFDAVVLEAVYPRISRAIENRFRLRLGPLAPIVSPLLLMQLKPRLNISPADLEPIKSIAHLGAPVLIVAGAADEHTTLPESEELYAAAVNPKGLWIVPFAHHQDFLAYRPSEYEARVVSFLTRALMSPPPSTAQKLDGDALEKWLGEKLTAGRPLRFEPFNGRIPCCDLGYPELRFLPGKNLEIFASGFIGVIKSVHYTIRKDGRITLDPSDDAELASWLLGKDLHDMFAYQYGPHTYLVSNPDSAPDFYFDQDTLWPFKYFAD